jgi:cobalamin biosynthesis Mg chelatase CobN
VSSNGGPNTYPPVKSYASICGAQDAPAPPAPPPVTTKPPAPAPVTTKAAAPAPTTAAATTAAAAAPSAEASSGGVDAQSTSISDSNPTSTSPAGASARPGPSTAVSLAAGHQQHDGGSPVGLIVGGVIAVGLVGAAGFTAWRRRPSGAGSP